MTANADTVRRPERGPFNELTKPYQATVLPYEAALADSSLRLGV